MASNGGFITAIIPAHDEESTVGDAIQSLHQQERVPDRVLVVCDNCTDNTRGVALGHGAEVITTHDNRDKKAGALNQALTEVLTNTRPDHYVVVLDADSTLVETFVGEASALMDGSGDVGAVGGIFVAAPKSATNFVEKMQAAEYTRYAREIARNKAKAKVITGTGALFRAEALREVRRARLTGELPTGTGVYDTHSLTEDNELTLALKHLGYECVSPKGCVVRTEVMQTWRRLWRQRSRWQRGGMENLIMYGVTRVTYPYILKMLFTLLAIFALILLMLLFMASWWSGTLEFRPPWMALGVVFVVERIVSVGRIGSGAMARSALLIPDLIYDTFLQVVFLSCVVSAILRRPHDEWGTHLIQSSPAEREAKGGEN